MTPSHPRRSATAWAAVALALGGAAPAAFGLEIPTGNDDLKLHWDSSVKYTLAYRLHDPDQAVAASAANPNVDFGDLAYGKGLINDRIDLTSEIDLSWRKSLGLRVSGAAWYDTAYQRSGSDYPASGYPPNTQAALAGGANDALPKSARTLMGNASDLRDAFVYGNTDLGDMKLAVRAGRHTVLYGETLFLGANGIAAAQGPVDLVKLYSQPNAQFKEIGLPVTQVSGDLIVNSELSFGAYYQFEWRGLGLPAVGSYFSPADFVGTGADLLLTPTGGVANRLADKGGADHGQFGGRVKFKLPGSDADFGLYAARYDDKSPIPVLNATAAGAYNGAPSSSTTAATSACSAPARRR